MKFTILSIVYIQYRVVRKVGDSIVAASLPVEDDANEESAS